MFIIVCLFVSQHHTVTVTLYYVLIPGRPSLSLFLFLRALPSDFSKLIVHVNFMITSNSKIKPNQTKQYFCFTGTVLNLYITLRRNTIYNGEVPTKNKISLSIYSRPVLCLSKNILKFTSYRFCLFHANFITKNFATIMQ